MMKAASALPVAAAPPARFCAADIAYDANGLRSFLRERDTTPVIPNNRARKRFHPFDRLTYTRRNLVERMVGRLKDFRRIAPATTSAPVTSIRPSPSQPSSSGRQE